MGSGFLEEAIKCARVRPQLLLLATVVHSCGCTWPHSVQKEVTFSFESLCTEHILNVSLGWHHVSSAFWITHARTPRTGQTRPKNWQHGRCQLPSRGFREGEEGPGKGVAQGVRRTSRGPQHTEVHSNFCRHNDLGLWAPVTVRLHPAHSICSVNQSYCYFIRSLKNISLYSGEKHKI